MYKVFLLPTPATLTLLQSMFAAGPVDVPWDSLSVELSCTFQPPRTEPPEVVYSALPGALSVWYDVATARSYLILPLVPSPAMAKRNHELGRDAFNRAFVPYMTLTDDPPTRRKRGSSFTNSIATGLMDRQPELTFWCETLIQDDSTQAAHYDFYLDYQARGALTNQVLLDADD